jgi:hypothetical protein
MIFSTVAARVTVAFSEALLSGMFSPFRSLRIEILYQQESWPGAWKRKWLRFRGILKRPRCQRIEPESCPAIPVGQTARKFVRQGARLGLGSAPNTSACFAFSNL